MSVSVSVSVCVFVSVSVSVCVLYDRNERYGYEASQARTSQARMSQEIYIYT